MYGKMSMKGVTTTIEEATDLHCRTQTLHLDLKKAKDGVSAPDVITALGQCGLLQPDVWIFVEKIVTKAGQLTTKHANAVLNTFSKLVVDATAMLGVVPELTDEAGFRKHCKANGSKLAAMQKKLAEGIDGLSQLKTLGVYDWETANADIAEKASTLSNKLLFAVLMYAAVTTYRAPNFKNNDQAGKKLQGSLKLFFEQIDGLASGSGQESQAPLMAEMRAASGEASGKKACRRFLSVRCVRVIAP